MNRRRFSAWGRTAFLIVLAAATLFVWSASRADTLVEHLDLVYAQRDGQDLKLDLYAPKTLNRPAPAIVVIHGGGWSSGSKEENRIGAQNFAQQGFVGVTIGYRLAPKHRFPAQVHDAKATIRWLRANAPTYHIDRDRIGVMGGSAGGHLALMLGFTGSGDGLDGDGPNAEQSSRVQAVVAICPPSDLTRPGWPQFTQQVFVNFLGGAPDQVADAYRAASPATYIDPADPPTLLIHGTADEIVPFSQSQLLHEALSKAGVITRLEPMEGKTHSWMDDVPALIRSGQLTLDFFREHLAK